jgi:hypothetical protein
MKARFGRPLAGLLWTLLAACAPAGPATILPTAGPTHAAATETAHPVATLPAVVPTAARGRALLPQPPQAAGALALLPGSAVTDFPGAESISLAAGPDGRIFALIGYAGNLFVSRSDDGGRSFGDPVLASVSAPATVLPIERPALAAGPDGQVGVAWLEVLGMSHARVWYAHSGDQAASFGPSVLVEESRGFETAMVRAALDAGQRPRLVWLDSSKLFYAASSGRGQTFEPARTLDDSVCECCQPEPVLLGDQMWVAYRNLEHDDQGKMIRDLFVLRSLDAGQTFETPARVSDAHWYLNACPIAGPSLAAAGGQRLYITWMDGRNDTHGTFSSVDVWFAASSDGGQTFSENVRVNPVTGHYNTLPVLGVDSAGSIHLSWEADETERTRVYYTISADEGRTFSAPSVIADSTADPLRGRPGKPALAVSGSGQVALAWLDGQGARVTVWPAAR